MSSNLPADGAADEAYSTPPRKPSATPKTYNHSPQTSPKPKHVAFELFFPESPNYRARLPMRVQIFPHDTTDSIITTVKNFYGLYEGPAGANGVSFEDEHGHTLIASYDNFKNGMVVYVRVLLETSSTPDAYGPPSHASASSNHAPNGYFPGEQHQMLPPQPAQVLTYGQSPSRPPSAYAHHRSVSPQPGRGRRSTSASANHDQPRSNRSRPGLKSRGSSAHGSALDSYNDAMNGFSDSDGGHGSVTSSRKAKSEQLASAEISLDNIVEGGRRKRAKFESSELPLFVPPQVPIAASFSSVSPARRIAGQLGPAPFAHPSQRSFSYTQPLPSPQSQGPGENGFGYGAQSASSYSTPSAPQHGHHLRNRVSGTFPSSRLSTGPTLASNRPGVLPTPDPTIASCISDEDVAIQLMRLGDASNISHGTRNSASTLDDGFSGAADAASSHGATSDSEDDGESDGSEHPSLPARQSRQHVESSPIPLPGLTKKKHKHLDEILPSFDSTEPSGDEYGQKAEEGLGYGEEKDTSLVNGFADARQGHVEHGLDQDVTPRGLDYRLVNDGASKSRGLNTLTKPSKVSKPRPLGSGKSKAKSSGASISKLPISPASLSAHSRKQSAASTINFQRQLGEDEEDLSSKPRCQRCRKSKKGCDRQRPCQRCKDAGIGIDGCVSEDEGNGRKGRFGRHMGVIVKKDPSDMTHRAAEDARIGLGDALATINPGGDKSKKRKR